MNRLTTGEQDQVPARLGKRLSQLQVIRARSPFGRAYAHGPRAAGERFLLLDVQGAQSDVPILAACCDALCGSGRQWSQGVEPPFRIGRQEDNAVAIGGEHDIGAAGPGLLKVVDAHLKRADAKRALAVAQRAGEEEAWNTAGRADRVESAAPALHRLLKIGTIGQVDSDETRFLVPVAGRKRLSLVIQDVEN